MTRAIPETFQGEVGTTLETSERGGWKHIESAFRARAWKAPTILSKACKPCSKVPACKPVPKARGRSACSRQLPQRHRQALSWARPALFGAFPLAYSVVLSALYLPLILMPA